MSRISIFLFLCLTVSVCPAISDASNKEELTIRLIHQAERIKVLSQLYARSKDDQDPMRFRLNFTPSAQHNLIIALQIKQMLGAPSNPTSIPPTDSAEGVEEHIYSVLASIDEQLSHELPDALEIKTDIKVNKPPDSIYPLLLGELLDSLHRLDGYEAHSTEISTLSLNLSQAQQWLKEIESSLGISGNSPETPESWGEISDPLLRNLEAHKNLQRLYRLERTLGQQAIIPPLFPSGLIQEKDLNESLFLFNARLLSIFTALEPEWPGTVIDASLANVQHEAVSYRSIADLGLRIERLIVSGQTIAASVEE